MESPPAEALSQPAPREPEPEPEPGRAGLAQEAVLSALCHKQKPTMRTWHERHARIVGKGLFFFDSADCSTDGVLEEPRGSSIPDVADCTVATGLEVFTFSESFPTRSTWFQLTLKRADLQGDGVTTLAFREERVRDTFAAALSNLAAGLPWDHVEDPPPRTGPGVIVRSLSRGSLSFKFPKDMLEPVPVQIRKGEPPLVCTEESVDPCCAALFKLGISSLQLSDAPYITALLVASHRVTFEVTRQGNFEFTDASNKTHTKRATSVGVHMLDFNAAGEECTITQVRRRTEAERRTEVRRQWPQLDDRVEVMSATANGWVAGVVESVDSDDEIGRAHV